VWYPKYHTKQKTLIGGIGRLVAHINFLPNRYRCISTLSISHLYCEIDFFCHNPPEASFTLNYPKIYINTGRDSFRFSPRLWSRVALIIKRLINLSFLNCFYKSTYNNYYCINFYSYFYYIEAS